MQRFTHEWEKTASLDFRLEHPEVTGTYMEHDRVREGTTEEMVDAAYLAWAADVRAGRSPILVAEAAETVKGPQPACPGRSYRRRRPGRQHRGEPRGRHPGL